jgi:hypothetical protein
MEKRTKIAIGVLAASVVVGAGGVAAAGGMGDDDGSERPITGPALKRASAAALAATGAGRVTGTEAGDEEGAYEVEVTLDDGTEVDVHLDEAFRVIGQESDVGDDGEDGR